MSFVLSAILGVPPPSHTQVMNRFPSLGVRMLRKILVTDGTRAQPRTFTSETVPVLKSGNGGKYITHRCSRLILVDGAFRAAHPDIGTSLADLRALATGLSEEKANERMELVGDHCCCSYCCCCYYHYLRFLRLRLLLVSPLLLELLLLFAHLPLGGS